MDRTAKDGPPPRVSMLRFDPFEFDPATGELRGSDKAVRLPPQQARVLGMLVGQPGRVVTREEIRRQVWGDDTFVDFDLALNLCINKIRIALGDDAREPRYVETLPRRGYRFVAPVEAPGSGASAPRLAVLPFDNLNRDPAQDPFADGLADAVITELGKLRGLNVVSRQSVLHLKGSRGRLTEIARDLGVDAVVEGSVLREGDRVRVTVQLVEVDPERHIWSQEYACELRDVLALQSRLACAITERVAATLSVAGPAADPQAAADQALGQDGPAAVRRTAGTANARRRRLLAWGAGVVSLVVLSAATAWLALGRRAAVTPIEKVGAFASEEGAELDPAFAPDGRQLAYVWDGEKHDNFDLYVQLVDEQSPRRLTSDPAFDFSPAWSPDGVHIAFLRLVPGGVDVRLIASAGGVERSLHVSRASCDLPLLVYRRHFCGLAWAPDGKSLAIVDKESPEGPNSIYRLDVESRSLSRLTTPPADGYRDGMSAFSPDGRTLAFARAHDRFPSDIHLLPLREDGRPAGEPRALTREGRPIIGLDWAADGRSLVFAWERGGPAGLWRVGVSGAEPERLAIGSEGAYGVSIARATNRLAYASSSISMDIWRAALPAPGVATPPDAAPFIASPFHDVHLACSADGERVVFSSGRSGDWELWRGDSGDSRSTRLTHLGGRVVFPTWSPDGRSILFEFKGWTAGSFYQLYVVDAEGGTPRRVTSGPFAEWAPAWSHDGMWIYFASNRGDGCGLWKVAAGGGEPVRVLRECGAPVFESADGRALFYGVGRRVLKAPLTGGAATLVLETPPRALWALGASGIYVLDPDAEGGAAISLLSFATGRSTRLVSLPGEPATFTWGLNGFTVSPDERLAFYERLDGRELDIKLVEGFR